MRYKLRIKKDNRRIIRSLVVLAIIFTTVFLANGPYLTYAASTIDTSTSSSATSNDSQRRTFFDTVNNRHWSLYYNGSAIEYSYSSDGTNWTSAGTLSYNTSDFSVSFKDISSTGYAYLATQCDSNDICVYRGTLSTTNISWGSAYKPFDGTGPSANYDKPAINLTRTNNIIVAARYYNGTAYRAYTNTSTNTNDPSTWATALTVGSANANLKNLVLMPNGTNLHLLLNAKDNKLTVFRYTGTTWAEENDGATGGWMTYGQPTGASSYIYALTADSQGNIYAGGNFSTIGGVSAAYIAKWDGNSWTTMGTGTNGAVRAITVDSSNNVYAGGSFTTAGGINAYYIAKWNGSAWSAMGTATGTNNAVYSLTADSQDNIYAGGTFTTIGGVSATRIAKWNGSAWSAMGTGASSTVLTLAADSSNNIYAGGQFTTINGVSAAYIAKWDGSTWSAMGTGASTYVNSIAVDSQDNVYAGGNFTSMGGVGSTGYIAKWDGSAWSAMGTGANGAVQAVTVDSQGNVYAGGSFTTIGGVSASRIAIWNGSAWSNMGTGITTGTTPYVYSFATDLKDDVYVGGYFTAIGGISVNHIAKWSGSGWSSIGTGANTNVLAIAVDSNNNIYAGGQFTTIGGSTINNIAMWNGTTWSAMGTATGTNSSINALAIDSSDNIYAGGAFTTIGGVSANYIAKWNGSAWSAMGTGANSTVNALTVDSNNNVYAGGAFTAIGGVTTNYIAKWDGSTWSAMGTGASGSSPYVNAITVDSQDNVYAGGRFTSMGGVSNTVYIAKWDGSAWSAMGTGANSYVNGLAVDSTDNIYAGGAFTAIGGVTTNYIAKWNGTSWSTMGAGADKAVNTVTIDSQDIVYAGGTYIAANGYAYLAKWDGSNWSAMGTGPGGPTYPVIYVLAVDSSDNIYAGGNFTTIGGVSAAYIAKWNGSDWSATGWGIMGLGANGSIYAITIDLIGRVYIGGTFTTVGGVTASRIAMWDGYKWNSLGTGITTGTSPYVYSFAVDSQNNLYVGGNFTAIGGISANRIAKWDGSAWSVLGTGANSYVQSLAIDSNDNIYAGGAFSAMGGVSNTAYIAKWDGSAWTSIGGTGASAIVQALVVDSSDNVYAGGNFTTIGGVSATRIAKYDGSTWTALGTGANQTVWAVAVDSNNNVYAGGQFTSIGGITTTAIAMWNGSAWSAMGTGGNNVVMSLAVDSSDNIYAGGSFSSMGGVSNTAYFARWDGSAWNSMVTSGASYTRAIAIDSSDNIYIGGDMTDINGISTGYMAKYTSSSSVIDSTSPWSAYTRGDKIYTIFNSSSQLHLATYDTAYRRWVNNITLQSSATNIDSMSLTAIDDTMYALYTESGSVKYYNTTGSNFSLLSNWNLTPTVAYSTGTNDNVSSADTTSTATFAGYAWTNGTGSPYDVMYGYVGDLPAPTEYTWTGSGDGTSWDDGDNWDAGGTFYPNSAAHKAIINTGSATINTPSGSALTIGELSLGSSYSGNLSLGNSLTVDNATSQNGNISIASGATLTTNGNDITIDGTFSNSGSFVADGSETFNFSLPTTSGTTTYSGFTGSLNLPQASYYNLSINASSGTVVTPATTTVNGALTLTNGTLDLQTNSTDITVKTGLTVTSGSVTTGSGTSYFLGDFHYADNSGSANFGNIEIGASPDTIDLDTDMICSSLTINSGDILNTNGYDIDCSGGISIASTGLLDATDDGEGDTSLINLGGNWTNSGTFTADDSTVTFDGTAAQSITSGTSDFYNLTTTNSSASGLTFTDSSGVTGTFTDNVSASTITFNAGSTYDFANINIAGGSGNEIVLQSSIDDSQWFLNVTQSYPSADYVNVKDSDATGGNEIDASTGGIDSGNNENWDFSGNSEPPEIDITSHYNNQFVSGTISVSGTASDNDSLDLVETKMDSESYVSATGTTSWSQSVDTTTYSNGEHTFYARATDGHGNTAVAQVILNIQNGVNYGTTETSDSINVNVNITSGISLACDPTVAMNDITGTGQSDLSSNDNNRATCTIVTNNSSGYNLTWKSASTGTMTNASSDSIAQYTPGTAGVAEPWSVSATASEWGAHLGYGSTTRDSGFWGTGTDARPAYATGYNWLNVSTTDFSIVQRATETSASGDTEYLWFGAEIGASSWQPTGTYTQTVTLTASTL